MDLHGLDENALRIIIKQILQDCHDDIETGLFIDSKLTSDLRYSESKEKHKQSNNFSLKDSLYQDMDYLSS